MLVDFGIAHAAGGEPLTQTGALVGTADYLSPEQAAGRTATSASDLYSLGVVAYACLTGSLPFHRDSDIATALAHLQDDVPDLPETVPADAGTLVDALLAKEPSARPASAHAVSVAAAALATSIPAPPGHAPEMSGEPTMPDAAARPGDTLPGIVERPVSVGAPGDEPATLVTAPTGGSVVAAEHVRRRRPRRMVLLSSALVVLIAAALGWMLLGGGADTVTVPNVDGKSQGAATAVLEKAGLDVDVRKVNVAHAKAGEVVRQTPTAGTDVDKGATVTLSVATGRVRIPVDKLKGSTYDEAVAILDKLGLGAEPAYATDDAAAGTVIAVDPSGTAKIGSTVTLTVSNGFGAPEPSDEDKGKGKEPKEEKKPSGKKQVATTPTQEPSTAPSPSPTPTEEPTDAP